MTIRADTVDHIPTGILASLYDGFGELGINLAASGTHGDGFLINQATLPAENDVEFQGLFTTAVAKVSGPGTLTSFDPDEDGGYIMVVTGEGVYEGLFTLEKDGVVDATNLLFQVIVGAGAIVTLTADPFSYSVAFADANTLVNEVLTADPFSYSVAFADAATSVIPIGIIVLTADPFSYSVAFADANTLVNEVLTADPFSYSVAFADVTTSVNKILQADPFNYSPVFTDVALKHNEILIAEAFSNTVVFKDALTSVLTGILDTTNIKLERVTIPINLAQSTIPIRLERVSND